MANPLFKSKTSSAPLDPGRHFRTDHLKRDLTQRSARGGVITVTTQVTRIALQTGSTVVLARLLLPEDYGLMGMVRAVTGFILLFRDLGLSAATVQKADVDHTQVSTLFWINLAISLVLAVFTIAVAPVTAWFYDEPRLVAMMTVLAGGYFFSGASVQHRALLSRQMRYPTLAVIDISSQLVAVGVAVVLAALGAGYWALVAMYLTGAGVHALGFWLSTDWRPGRPRWSREVASMLGFGGGLTGSTVVTYLIRNFDNILIGWYWGANELGLYTRAYQLLVIPLISINSPIRGVAIPTLSRLTDKHDRYRRAYLRILEKIVLLAMPLVAWLSATSDWLVVLLLGEQWQEVSEIFRWLSLVALFIPITYTLGWLFISLGRTWEMFRLWTLCGSVTVGAFFIGLPWGATGVAVAYAASELCLGIPLRCWYGSRISPVKLGDFGRTVIPSLAAAIGTLGILSVFRAWADISNPLLGATITFALTLAVAPAIAAFFPAGRRSLQDSVSILAAIVNSRFR